MEDLVLIICVLSAVVAVIAVVGHGLWLLAALFFRFLTGERPKSERLSAPPRIERQSQSWQDEVQATLRELSDLHARGVITTQRFEQLVGLLDQSDIENDLRAGQEVPTDELAMLAEVIEPVAPAAAPPAARPPAPAAAAVPPSELHPLDRVEPEPVAEPAKEKIQPFSLLLRAFMEEKNIRWGELVSGMLIVGSAIGLVISLWATLRDTIPYFPAMLFMLLTAGIYAAGMYTLRRWRLHSTSRGLLLIAMLLIPLNFLAGIAVSPKHHEVTDPLYWLAVVVGLLVFGWIAVSASRALLVTGFWLLVIAVMGTSVGQLVIDRFVGTDMTLAYATVLAVPAVASCLVAIVGQLALSLRWRRLSARRAAGLLLVLGISCFAVLFPLALLVWQSGDVVKTLRQLSPCTSLIAASALGLGLVVHRRATALGMSAYRMAGTTISLLAGGLTIGALCLAWPRTDVLIAVGVVNLLALTSLAYAARFHYLHIPAIGCGALACLLAFHVWKGSLSAAGSSGWQLVDVLLWGRSGLLLMVLSAIPVGIAGLLVNRGRLVAALANVIGAALVASASVAIALYAGFSSGIDGNVASLILAVYAAALLVVSAQVPTRIVPAVGCVGSALLLATSVHSLLFNDYLASWLTRWGLVPWWPVVTAMLCHATICAIASLCPGGFLRAPTAFRQVMTAGGLATSAAVLPAVLWVSKAAVGVHAAYAFWTSVVWLVVAIVLRSRPLLAGFQIIATLAVCFAVTAICQRQPWWEGIVLDPRHLNAQMAVLALWAMIWTSIRLGARRWWPVGAVRAIRPTSVDRVFLQLAAIGMIALAVAGCMPGVASEMGMSQGDRVISPVSLLDDVDPIYIGILVSLAIAGLAAVAAGALGSREPLGLGPLALLVLIFIGLAFSKLGPLTAAAWPAIGVAHTHACGPGSWLALALIGLAIAAALWERCSTEMLAVGLLSATAVPLLIAGRWEGDLASASMLRWGLGGLAVIVGALLCQRTNVVAVTRRGGWRVRPRAMPQIVETLRAISLGQTVVPLLVLSMGALVVVASGRALAGPDTGTLFARIGPAVSYGGPLFLAAAVFVGYALREKSTLFMLGASLLLNVAVSVACLLTLWPVALASPQQVLITLLHVNITTLAVSTLLWVIGCRFLVDGETDATSTSRTLGPALLAHLVLIAVWFSALAAWATLCVFLFPDALPRPVKYLGSSGIFLALAVSTVAGIAVVRLRASAATLRPKRQGDWVHVMAFFGLVAAPLIAAAMSPWNAANNWLAYHVLSVGVTVVAALLTALSVLYARRPASMWVGAAGVAVVVFAVRGVVDDPLRPWWSCGITAALAALAVLWAVRWRSNKVAYASTILAALAATCVALVPWINLAWGGASDGLSHIVWLNLTTIALMALLWVSVNIYWQRRHDQSFRQPHELMPALSNLAAPAVVSVAALFVPLAVTIAAAARGGSNVIHVAEPMAWLAVGSLALLLFASLWDRDARYAPACIYLVGLVAAFLALDHGQYRLREYVLWVACSLAGYVLLTGIVWSWRRRWAMLAYYLGTAELGPRLERTGRWLPVVNVVLALLVVVLAGCVVLDFEQRWMRGVAAAAIGVLVPGIAALADTRSATRMRYLSLMFAAVATVYASWAVLPMSGDPQFWLHRAIRLMVALAGVTFAYGLIVVRIVPVGGNWYTAARRAAITVCMAAIVALLWTLVMEGVLYRPEVGSPVSAGEITQVIVVLVGLAAALISMALLPGTDPLGFGERGRMLYVYAAELVLALLFVHIYLTMPELFHGRMRPYWPFIVMGIAFAGLTVGALARRAGLVVLAEPLERTGTFLPLLPALGYWLLESRVSYSSTLFFVGMLYALLAMSRRHFVYGCLAAVAGNGALWALLDEQKVSLFSHPQFWMIPPAVCLLVGAHLNRYRLTAGQLTAIRYFASLVIYVSATGEMFITGVGESLWPPMALATLSVLGILAGILFQIRAFLYLGFAFLSLSIISMVWHAARNIGHVWPWWAFGIALGIAILTLFGVFEKKRNEITSLLDDLRKWEP